MTVPSDNYLYSVFWYLKYNGRHEIVTAGLLVFVYLVLSVFLFIEAAPCDGAEDSLELQIILLVSEVEITGMPIGPVNPKQLCYVVVSKTEFAGIIIYYFI